MTRKRFTLSDRRAQLLDAAVAAAEQVGYHNVTKAAVAAVAECSPGLVWYVLGDKPDLQRALMEHAVAVESLPVIAAGLAAGDMAAAKAPLELRRRALASLT